MYQRRRYAVALRSTSFHGRAHDGSRVVVADVATVAVAVTGRAAG
jgi:hypothetical protein